MFSIILLLLSPCCCNYSQLTMIKGLLLFNLTNAVLPAAIYPFPNGHYLGLYLGHCISAISRPLHLGHADEVAQAPPSISTKPSHAAGRHTVGAGRHTLGAARRTLLAAALGPHRSVIFQLSKLSTDSPETVSGVKYYT